MDSYSSGKEIRMLKIPSVSSTELSVNEETDYPKEHVSAPAGTDFSKFNVQIPNLVTLSLLPRSQWQSLTMLDIIKVLSCLILVNSVTCFPFVGCLKSEVRPLFYPFLVLFKFFLLCCLLL